MDGIENWKKVVGYEDLYEISNFGNIRYIGYDKRYEIGELMSRVVTNRGFLNVNLYNKEGKRKFIYVSRLVAENFIDNPYNYKVVAHIDKNKLNVKADNLYWVSSDGRFEKNGRLYKRCRCCKKELLLEQFDLISNKNSKRRYRCKKCRSIANSESPRAKDYYIKNREKIISTSVKSAKERKKNDPKFRMLMNLRSRVGMALKSKSILKCDKTIELIGCSIDEFKLHVESLWLPGMSWENYGLYTLKTPDRWNLDHIKPCKLFDLTQEEQQRECFNYKNIQPLWGLDNLRKNAKYESES